MRRLIGWLIPLCAILVALYGPKVWASTHWGIEWFAESGRPMLSAPQVTFPTKEDCKAFGEDGVAMAEVEAGIHITFKCRALPFIEAFH